ncbi:replication protein RepA (plasmid) [Sphaerotilaceae bacterium SBD11-9]
MTARKNDNVTIDYRSGQPMPEWVREVIDAHLAIEAEDAKSAGALGFMARALVIATMPYKDPKADAFVRTNGDFKLRIVAGYEGGIPYGIYPRLLMAWVTTEAVSKQSPVIELGDSLRLFMRDVLELRSTGGGARGSGTRVSEQMKRLFGSLVTAQYTGGLDKRGFTLKNVLIADDLELDGNDMDLMDGKDAAIEDGTLWTPQPKHVAGQWRSQVRLSTKFFTECVQNPVPIDLRAYKSLRGNPLAMDVYNWLTYRMSYTHRRSRPIRWESLMMQFGSGYNMADVGQAVRDFKKAFLRALRLVLVVYPQAKLEINENGLVLLPSRPHVAPIAAGPQAKRVAASSLQPVESAAQPPAAADGDGQQSALF